MRPVSKGTAPRAYAKFSEAQPDLASRIGRFCSYCERRIPSGLCVEHKRPRSRYPAEELEWSNFLLACDNCNGCKGHPRIALHRYLWPDTDNTLRAFRYTDGGLVRAMRTLPRRLKRKAGRTLRLLGLDKHPGHFYAPTDRDLRWQDRREQWDKAQLFKDQLAAQDTPQQRSLTIVAASDGIFSIWWTVFKVDADMRRLREAFAGTDASCFNVTENTEPRQGGQV